MRSRAEAARLAEEFMDTEAKPEGALTWHFGYVELRKLMDFIYDGPPNNESENIRSSRVITGGRNA